MKAQIESLLAMRTHFWSGNWLITRRISQLEHHLGAALEKFGEDSLEARRLTLDIGRQDRKLLRWGSTPHVVDVAIADGSLASVPIRDQQLLVLNRLFMVDGQEVRVRRTRWAWAGALLVLALVATAWLTLATLIMFSPASIAARGVAFLGVNALFWLIWPGAGLFTIQPLIAAHRSGEAIEHLLASRSICAPCLVHSIKPS